MLHEAQAGTSPVTFLRVELFFHTEGGGVQSTHPREPNPFRLKWEAGARAASGHGKAPGVTEDFTLGAVPLFPRTRRGFARGQAWEKDTCDAWHSFSLESKCRWQVVCCVLRIAHWACVKLPFNQRQQGRPQKKHLPNFIPNPFLTSHREPARLCLC